MKEKHTKISTHHHLSKNGKEHRARHSEVKERRDEWNARSAVKSRLQSVIPASAMRNHMANVKEGRQDSGVTPDTYGFSLPLINVLFLPVAICGFWPRGTFAGWGALRHNIFIYVDVLWISSLTHYFTSHSQFQFDSQVICKFIPRPKRTSTDSSRQFSS